MSNARIRAERARVRAWQGPTTAPETARRLAHLHRLRALALEEKRLEERDENRIIPVGGPRRRRAKARRNARAVQRTELLRRVERVRAIGSRFAFPRTVINDLCDLLEVRLDDGDTPETQLIRDLEERWENRAWVAIDPNVRVGEDRTRAGFNDCSRPIFEGEAVRAVETVEGIETDATVVSLDRVNRLVYLTPAQHGWREVTDIEGLERLRAQERQNHEVYRLAGEQGLRWDEADRLAGMIHGLHGIGVSLELITERVAEATRTNEIFADILEAGDDGDPT